MFLKLTGTRDFCLLTSVFVLIFSNQYRPIFRPIIIYLDNYASSTSYDLFLMTHLWREVNCSLPFAWSYSRGDYLYFTGSKHFRVVRTIYYNPLSGPYNPLSGQKTQRNISVWTCQSTVSSKTVWIRKCCQRVNYCTSI